jgi:hypothetical protein
MYLIFNEHRNRITPVSSDLFYVLILIMFRINSCYDLGYTEVENCSLSSDNVGGGNKNSLFLLTCLKNYKMFTVAQTVPKTLLNITAI